jgi:enterochelin esterase-like enzyme
MGAVLKTILVLTLWIGPMFVGDSSKDSVSKSPTATPTPAVVCSDVSGDMTSETLDSDLLGKAISIRVYKPPCYDPNATTRYPVLYLLHGQSNNEKQWENMGIQEMADQLIAKGLIEPLIIVMPGEKAYLEDARKSKFGDALLTEVLPWVEARYPISQERTNRAIGGLSRGAGWAMHLGLSRPDLFGSISGHSLAQIGGDTYRLNGWRRKTTDESLPRIYIDIGLEDPYKDTARAFELKLSEYSYPHEWHLNLGTHNGAYWSGHLREYLLWYDLGWHDPSSSE